MVVQKLPMAWLQSHLPDIVKAALAVLKHLPTHASLEQAQLLKSLTTIMHLVIPQVRSAYSLATPGDYTVQLSCFVLQPVNAQTFHVV